MNLFCAKNQIHTSSGDARYSYGQGTDIGRNYGADEGNLRTGYPGTKGKGDS